LPSLPARQEKAASAAKCRLHHKREHFLDEYFAAPASGGRQDPLFGSTIGNTGPLTDKPMNGVNAYRMVGRRTAEGGLKGKLGCHVLRATGITAYFDETGGTLENAQAMGRTRKLAHPRSSTTAPAMRSRSTRSSGSRSKHDPPRFFGPSAVVFSSARPDLPFVRKQPIFSRPHGLNPSRGKDMAISSMDQPEVAIFVQLNDLYHIDYSAYPVDHTTRILPRIATLLRRLRRQFEPHRVHFCLPGDFLSPSCLSRTHRARQMIDILNLLKLRVAVFGNHEFDFEKKHFTIDDLLKRIKQSKFLWLASNLIPAPKRGGNDFFKQYDSLQDALSFGISPLHDIHVFGLLYSSEYGEFGKFLDPITRCRALIQKIKNSYIDRDGFYQPARTTFVALTHQTREDDIKLAQEIPELRLVMGGHDHEMLEKVRAGNEECLIVKAKSNARTLRLNLIAWTPKDRVQRLTEQFGSISAVLNDVGPRMMTTLVNVALTGHVEVPASIDQHDPQIVEFIESVHGSAAPDRPGVYLHSYHDDGAVIVMSVVLDTLHPGFRKLVEADGETNKHIDRWLEKSPEHRTVLLHAPVTLETNDDACRARSSNFGNMIADLVRGRLKLRMASRVEADVAFVNGGSFRLGRDIVRGEPITKSIVCDLLYHANDVRLYRVPGSAVDQIINRCYQQFRGQGNFLQISGLIVEEDGTGGVRGWICDSAGHEQPLDLARYYSVATTAYVATHADAYREIFEPFEPPTIVEDSIRAALERELLAQGSDLVITNTARWRLVS
jgi:2',3'-cyclic-nucleotide 2'-phosphodiesterase (5'-nucleotidase family)